MYGTVHETVHNTVHIYDMMTWRWPMTWHQPMTWQNSIERMMWHWLLMWRWLMSWRWPMICHDAIELKCWCDVDQWCGSMLVDQETCVWYMYYTKWQPWWCVLSNQNLPRGAILSVQIVLICGHDWIIVSKKGALPLIWHPWIHFLAPFSIIPSPSCIFYVF